MDTLNSGYDLRRFDPIFQRHDGSLGMREFFISLLDAFSSSAKLNAVYKGLVHVKSVGSAKS